MAVGELVVNIFPNKVMMELFVLKNKKYTLVAKDEERYVLSFEDFNKIDLMDIEKLILKFLGNTSIKAGKVYINVHKDDVFGRYTKIDMDMDSAKEIKKLLPFEIESLDSEFDGTDYRYVNIGSNVYLYFLDRNLLNNLNNLDIGSKWDLVHIKPSFANFQPLFHSDGVLVDVYKDRYILYSYKNGLLLGVEKVEILKDMSYYLTEEKTEITLTDLTDSIKDELVMYIRNFNFNNSTELDNVFIISHDNIKNDLSDFEYDGLFIQNYKDLREKLDKPDFNKEYLINPKYKSNSIELSSSLSSMATFYKDKKLDKLNFSRDRVHYLYKNILISTISFSLILSTALPSISYITGNKVENEQNVLSEFETSVVQYGEMIKGLEDEIEGFDGIISDYNSYVDSLSDLTDTERNFISSILDEIPKNTPSTIIVNHYEVDKSYKTILIRGVSQNYKDIGSFAIELEDYGTVKINNIENNELLNLKGYPFEIVLTKR